MADGGGGVNVDARLAVSHLGNYSGNKGNAQHKQFVCYTIVGESTYHGITTDNLSIRVGGRIAIVGSLHVSSQDIPQCGEPLYEIHGYLLGTLTPLASVLIVLRFMVIGILFLLYGQSGTQTRQYLFGKQCMQSLHAHTQVISLHAGADGRLSEVTGKEYRAAQVNHLGQCLLAGQWVSVSVLK